MNKTCSRREGRYQRRKLKRQQNLLKRNQQVGTLEQVYNYRGLYRSGKQCCRNVRWKASTQSFELHLFSGTARRRKQVRERKWKADKYHRFIINERGKTRFIDAPRIQDRQVHKIFTTNVLLPLYTPAMIYNNGASLPGKGFDFSRRELIKDLHYHFRRYGREGRIILLDFKQFFPTVSHQKIFKRHKQIILNDEIRSFADDIVSSAGNDFGLPLGVEPSQAEMIAFPSQLDNFIKCQLSLKGMGHYMDDYYVIVPPNREAKPILKQIIEKAQELKLTISSSKTQILPLSRPFKFCKIKYVLTATGKIITNGCRNNLKRARKKIKSFKRMVENNLIDYQGLWASINGMMAYFEKYDDHNRLLRLRRLFYSIYGFSCEKMKNFQVPRRQNEVYNL